jgi:hypothetical protein
VEVSDPYLILSIKVIGVRLQHVTHKAVAEAEMGKTLTHSLHSSSNQLAYICHDTKWKRQDTHKGPTSYPYDHLCHLSHFYLKFYQEDIVQRNNSRSYGIVLVCSYFYSLSNRHSLQLILLVL